MVPDILKAMHLSCNFLRLGIPLSESHSHCRRKQVCFFSLLWDILQGSHNHHKKSGFTEMWLKNHLEIAGGASHNVQSREHRSFENMNPSDLLNLEQLALSSGNMGPGCACHIGAIRLAVGWLWHGLFQTPSQCPVLHVPRWHLVGRSWASKASSLGI